MKFGIAIEKSVPTDDYGFDSRIVRTQVWVGDQMPGNEEINETLQSMADQQAISVVVEQQRRLHLGWRVVQQVRTLTNTTE